MRWVSITTQSCPSENFARNCVVPLNFGFFIIKKIKIVAHGLRLQNIIGGEYTAVGPAVHTLPFDGWLPYLDVSTFRKSKYYGQQHKSHARRTRM